MQLSCKIFEHFALQVDPVIGFIQPGSTPFKESAILVPKLSDPPFWWKSNSTPSKSGSGLPDLDQLIFCTIERCLLDEIQLLRNQISSCQHVCYYTMVKIVYNHEMVLLTKGVSNLVPKGFLDQLQI